MGTQKASINSCWADGCDRTGTKRGLCANHYYRFRAHGDPNKGRIPNGSLQTWISEVALKHTSDACLIWPFKSKSRDGYGYVKWAQKTSRAHRVVCLLAHGYPTSPRLVAAHSCGNRLCVNPLHIRWATCKENQADSLLHGTRARGERMGPAKLTESQVMEIRCLNGVHAEIAQKYGVSRRLVGLIKNRDVWSWLT